MTGEYIREMQDAAWREKYWPRGTASGPARNVEAGLRQRIKELEAACEAAQEYLCGPHNAIDRKLVATKLYEALKGGGA